MNTPHWVRDPDAHLGISTPSGVFDAYVARPPHASSLPAVVVLHEIFGINDDMRETCERLASEGFIAICPDLFWRRERHVQLNSWTAEEWQRGFALYQSFDLNLGWTDVATTARVARSMRGANGKVAVMGFCLGGLLTSAPEVTLMHPSHITDRAPRSSWMRRMGIATPLLMHVAGDDEFIPPAAQARITESLARLPSCEVHIYESCRHGFARNRGEHFDERAATLSFERTVRFLKMHLTGR